MIAKGKLQTSGSGKNNYASVGGLFDAYATKLIWFKEYRIVFISWTALSFSIR